MPIESNVIDIDRRDRSPLLISGHESFIPRHGWFTKLYHVLQDEPEIFRDDDRAIIRLGIGRNMVKSLRFWAGCFGLLRPGGTHGVSDFAHAIFHPKKGIDPFLDESDTIWRLHWVISTHIRLAAWQVLASLNDVEISRSDMISRLMDRCRADEKRVTEKTASSHLDIFLRLYDSLRHIDAAKWEDGLGSPFADIDFLKVIDRGGMSMISAPFRGDRSIGPKTMAFIISDYWRENGLKDTTISLRNLLLDEKSPGIILRLNESCLHALLQKMCDSSRIGILREDGIGGVNLVFNKSDDIEKLEKIFMEKLNQNTHLDSKNSMIASHVKIARRYVRAIDLARDMQDPEALEGFIITPSVRLAMDRLNMGLRSTSGQRAFRITGSYGSGKSSFAVFLAQGIMEKKRAKSIMEESNIEPMNEKMIPFVLIGRRVSLGDDILSHLVLACDGMNDLLLNIKKTQKERVKGHRDPDKVISHIESYATEMKKRGKMLVLLIDEMGRYIEYAASADDEDPSIFQRLAEKACGPHQSPYGIVAFLHSQFSDYAAGIGKWEQSEWMRSAERYEDMAFDNSDEASIHLLANAIHHQEMAISIQKKTNKLYNEAVNRHIFSWRDCDHSPDISRLYPLHPSVAACLVSASRRFGQSERSMFSFLSAGEIAGFISFINRVKYHANNWYRLPDYYDYLSAQPSLRLGASDRERRWNEIRDSIATRHNLDRFEIDILKTVGILITFDPLPGMRPDANMIAWCLDEKVNIVKSAIKKLIDEDIFWQRPGGNLALRSGSSVDLDHWYENAKSNIPRIPSMEQVEPYAFVAHRHYHKTGVLRAFPFIISTKPQEAKAPFGDGMVCVVPAISKDDHKRLIEETLDTSRNHGLSNIYSVTLITKQAMSAAHDFAAWEWVDKNCHELRLDSTARMEVCARRDAASQKMMRDLRPFSDSLLKTTKNVTFIHNGECIKIKSRKELNEILSESCDKRFHLSPILRNDLINRQRMSSGIGSARVRLVDAMLTQEEIPGLGFEGSPPERTIYLSMFHESGIHAPMRDHQDDWHFRAPSENDPLRWRPAWDALNEMVNQEGGLDIPVILDNLSQEPYGIRQSPAFLLIAAYMMVERANLALMEKGTYRPDPDASCFARMFKMPQYFNLRKLSCDNGDSLASRLATILRGRPSVLNMPENPDIKTTVQAIYKWSATFKPFVWETKKISREARAVRLALRKARDPIYLIEKQLPIACGYEDVNDKNFIPHLKNAFDELQNAFPNLRRKTLSSTLQAFGSRSVDDVKAYLKEEMEPLLPQLTDFRLRAFVTRSLDNEVDDDRWIETIGSLLMSKRLEAWNDDDFQSYIFNLRECVGQMNRFIALSKSDEGEGAIASIHLALPNGENHALYLRQKMSKDDEKIITSLEKTLKNVDDPQRVLLQLLKQQLEIKENK